MRSHCHKILLFTLALLISVLPIYGFSQYEYSHDVQFQCANAIVESFFTLTQNESLPSVCNLQEEEEVLLLFFEHSKFLHFPKLNQNIVLCKKASSSGQVCIYMPLRL